MDYKLEPLPYAYNSLEPFIDEATMKVHHDGHHKTYCDKLNTALKDHPELKEQIAEELLINLDTLPKSVQTQVRNFGGGFANHSFFWTILKKDIQISGEIKNAIEKEFSSFEKFKEEFTKQANALFGSGYTWLVVNENSKLEIVNSANQDSPLTIGKIPLLNLDLWEHAHYLKYQNKKADYIEAFFNIINWDKVNEYYKRALM